VNMAGEQSLLGQWGNPWSAALLLAWCVQLLLLPLCMLLCKHPTAACTPQAVHATVADRAKVQHVEQQQLLVELQASAIAAAGSSRVAQQHCQ
jgi:hypothetical protein